MAGTLHLVIPGLLDPAQAFRRAALPLPPAPALTRLLSRAEVRAWPAPGAHETLFQLFGQPSAADGRDPPVAAVTRLADGGRIEEIAAAWWLRADPVSLEADMRQVLLSPAWDLDIDPAEAQALATECNTLLQADGLSLEAPEPTRWYIRLADDPGLHTRPLADAVGRDITPLLPEGPARRRWRALLTELQMLLHASAVNAQRQARGRRPVNSVWFWGGGFLPRPMPNRFASVHAADPVGRGLARLAGVEPAAATATADVWQAAAGHAAESLVVLDDTRYDRADGDLYAWAEHVAAVEQSWFFPCLTWLTGDALDCLHIYPCNHRAYTVTRRRLRQFWRRLRPWTAC